MTRQFRGLKGVCAPFFGGRGIRRLVGYTLTSLMDLLVQDQGHLLARDLTDKRTSLLLAGSVKQRNSCPVALTTLSQSLNPKTG